MNASTNENRDRAITRFNEVLVNEAVTLAGVGYEDEF